MGIFELNLTMPEDFLLLAIIPSELYVFGHIFGRSKSYRKALPSRCSSQLELSGTLSPISRLGAIGCEENPKKTPRKPEKTRENQKKRKPPPLRTFNFFNILFIKLGKSNWFHLSHNIHLDSYLSIVDDIPLLKSIHFQLLFLW